jgi:hypothetical protein
MASQVAMCDARDAAAVPSGNGWRYGAASEASQVVVHQDGDRVTFVALPQQWATFHVGKLLLQQWGAAAY